MAEQEQDRSEQATAYKITKAREKGMVPRSPEVNTALVVAAFLGFLYFGGGEAARRFGVVAVKLLSRAHTFVFGQVEIFSWSAASVFDTLRILAPLFGLVMAAGVVSALLQFGIVLTAQPLKPDWQRINPVAGFKRIFSKRALFETAKNLVKLALFGTVLYLGLRAMLDDFMRLPAMPPQAQGERMLHSTALIVLYLLIAMIAVAIADMLFTRREYARQLMMSRREIKEEVKHREGDPKIKARIRELQNEMRQKSRAIKNVPGADVLITNPTHIAVAISYKDADMPAPRIVAKGAGELVEPMKQLARRHGVMIIENRALARELYGQKLNTYVQPSQYAAVARILIWVQEARRIRNQSERPFP
jgi:flagellar biosynthetic protein FlhB